MFINHRFPPAFSHGTFDPFAEASPQVTSPTHGSYLEVGAAGCERGLCCQLKEALSQHQLVKVRFVEFKEERKSMARHLADSVGCHLVTVVGHVAVFFQPAPLSDAQASGEESSELMA